MIIIVLIVICIILKKILLILIVQKKIGDYTEIFIKYVICYSDLIKYLSRFVKKDIQNDYFANIIFDNLNYGIIKYIIDFLNKINLFEIELKINSKIEKEHEGKLGFPNIYWNGLLDYDCIDIDIDIDIDYFDELIKSVIKDEYKNRKYVNQANELFLKIINELISNIKF